MSKGNDVLKMLQTRKKIIVIEPHPELREALKLVINGSFIFSVTGSFEGFREALKHIHKNTPDIILMDLDIPDANGIEATFYLKERFPHIKIIINSNYDDSEIILEALKGGAVGYIMKESGYTELLTALEKIDKEGVYLSSRAIRAIISNYHINHESPITYRERQILQMMSAGKTYSQIAGELSISRETSKTHMRNIYHKLNVNSKSAAIAKANEDRLI